MQECTRAWSQTMDVTSFEKALEESEVRIRHFWITNQNSYVVLRNGWKAIIGTLKSQPGWTWKNCEWANAGKYKSCTKTLNRFANSAEKKTLMKQPLRLAWLVLLAKFIIDKEPHFRIVKDVDELLSLIAQFEQECKVRIASPEIIRKKNEYDRPTLEVMLKDLEVPEVDDPLYPEYPPLNPRFPATPTRPIRLSGRVVWVKDEGDPANPTGSFKDRAAHEYRLGYKKLLREQLEKGSPYVLPSCSIISSGSMGLAVQYAFLLSKLPNLNILMDRRRTRRDTIGILQRHFARVHLTDLSEKELSKEEVCERTENPGGIDLTIRGMSDVVSRALYDWLGYELLLFKPKHVFFPFGGGDAVANFAHLVHSEIKNDRYDRRLIHGTESLQNVNIYGATTNDPKSQMDKLYAPYRPAREEIEGFIERCKKEGTIGPHSGIFTVSDESAIRAAHALTDKCIATEISGSAGAGLFLEMHRKIPLNERVMIVNTGRFYLPPVLS
jgi:Pyridoxal-phosphate dependent enzyme